MDTFAANPSPPVGFSFEPLSGFQPGVVQWEGMRETENMPDESSGRVLEAVCIVIKEQP